MIENLMGIANNKGADQPAHPRRLISAFVIRVLEGIISKHATSEILIFCSRGDWFESRFDGNPEDRFCRDEAQIIFSYFSTKTFIVVSR